MTIESEEIIAGHILYIFTNRGPHGLFIALGKNLESHASGLKHYYIA